MEDLTRLCECGINPDYRRFEILAAERGLKGDKMAKNKEGTCHLCGHYGKLSFEHIPPKKAFNDCPVSTYNYFMGIAEGNYDIKKSQKGLGDYTLCVSCNNNTGSWYGTQFIDWARQSMNLLEYTSNRPSLYYRFRIFPLRVIKQIACMMFSVNVDQFRNDHQELVKFVLNKEEQYLNPDTKFFAYFNPKGIRVLGGIGKLITNEINPEGFIENVSRLRTKIERHRTLSEVAFPPLGYVLAFDSEKPDSRLVDISYFAKFRYNDMYSVELRLPMLSVDSPYPTDYRPLQELECGSIA